MCSPPPKLLLGSFFMSFMVHCKVNHSFTNKPITFWVYFGMFCLWTFPFICPPLLPKSHMSNVSRHWEILTNASYFSLPKARRICRAAGGAAPFQALHKSILAKLLGNTGWTVGNCSSTPWSSQCSREQTVHGASALHIKTEPWTRLLDTRFPK